jgi:hypothetical protein
MNSDNHAAAAVLLPARLAVATRAASSALADYGRNSAPRITREGMQQVVDIVWAAEAYPGPKPTPDTYMDLSYMARALAPPVNV